MRSLLSPTVAFALSFPVLVAAQESTNPPKEPTAKIAEVRFGDGSVVRMNLLQEQLEVTTKYGKLSVPVADIRRIEFGMHMPGGLGEQIGTSIKLLGSEVYRD